MKAPVKAPLPAARGSREPAANDAVAAFRATDGICVTEHEFLLRGEGEAGRTGVLLVHGLTGTPNEMRLLARGLNRAGFTVYGVQLAGHCGQMEDLLATRWQDWYASVQAGAERLAPQVDRLVVAGLSMGAVLSLALAEERPDLVCGVAALSVIFRHDGWSMPFYTRFGGVLLPILRALRIGRHKVFMEQPPYGIKDEALRRQVVGQMHAGDSAAAGLPGNPWWSVIEMHALSRRVLSRLSAVRAPCLVMHAREDDVATVENARAIVRGVTQAPVELVLLDDSYHMITVDRERRTVIRRTVAFVQSLAGLVPAEREKRA